MIFYLSLGKHMLNLIKMKTRKKTNLLAVLCLFISFCSCVNDIKDGEDESGLISVSISSHIQENMTRVTNTTFEENDAIGLYLLAQPSKIDEDRHADNSKFVFSTANGFKPDKEIYFPENDEICDFISYYPYQKSGIKKNGSTMNITIATNQSEWSTYSSSDFLVATAKDIQPSRNPVDLLFRHKFYKMNIQLKPGDGYTLDQLLAANPEVKVTNVKTKVSYDFETDDFKSLSVDADVTPNGAWEKKNGMLVGKSAILIPQMIKKSSKIIEITMGGRIFQCVFDDAYILEAGKAEDYTLTIKERIIPEINTSIEGWGEHKQKEMEAKEADQIKNYIDISELSFTDSYIYKVISEGTEVAQICKEYLFSEKINSQAIVIYPVKNGDVNLQNGLVLKINQ